MWFVDVVAWPCCSADGPAALVQTTSVPIPCPGPLEVGPIHIPSELGCIMLYIYIIYIYVTVSGERVHSAQNVPSSYKRL